MDRQQLWDRLAELLSQACDQERHRLKPEAAALIEEFIEHREYGVAYDWLKDALESEGVVPSELTKAALDQAASLMGV